ncbi:HIT family protein [soil metagenome]
MGSAFTRIIEGELPGRFVWSDEWCVAFLSINPIRPGHTLVVPRQEVDHWLDLDLDLAAHLTAVSRSIGKAIQKGFEPSRVGLVIAGLEVPHVHFHLLQVDDLQDLNFENAVQNPDPAELDEAAETIRRALEELGFRQVAR